jgi:hypothetical protein
MITVTTNLITPIVNDVILVTSETSATSNGVISALDDITEIADYWLSPTNYGLPILN